MYFDTSYNGGLTYKSIKQLPNILDTTNLWQYTFVHNDGMRTENLNFINPQKFKVVGYNKWLRGQVYITIDLDNYNPDKLSSDTKKLMNKKNIWSL